MPRSAITTGAVDLVLPVAEIPDATHRIRPANSRRPRRKTRRSPRRRRRRTGCRRSSIFCARRPPYDFTLYKQGTLQRRIERRMAMAAIEADDMDRYLDMLRSDEDELDLLAKDLAHQRHQLFPRSEGVRSAGREDHSGPGPQPPARSAAAHLDRGMQHRRGDLFPCHALPRADRGGKAQHQAAGLRLRCRSGCGGERPRGPLPGIDRGGRVAGAARPLLREGGPRLPRVARTARRGGLHGAGCAGRSAVLAPRPDFLPESSDLSAARSAGEGPLAVPFRAARGRHPAAWQLRRPSAMPMAASR